MSKLNPWLSEISRLSIFSWLSWLFLAGCADNLTPIKLLRITNWSQHSWALYTHSITFFFENSPLNPLNRTKPPNPKKHCFGVCSCCERLHLQHPETAGESRTSKSFGGNKNIIISSSRIATPILLEEEILYHCRFGS